MAVHETFQDQVHLHCFPLFQPLALEGLEQMFVELTHYSEASAFVEEVKSLVVFFRPLSHLRTLLSALLGLFHLLRSYSFHRAINLRSINPPRSAGAQYFRISSYYSVFFDPNFCSAALFLGSPERFLIMFLCLATYLLGEHVVIVPTSIAPLSLLNERLSLDLFLLSSRCLHLLEVESRIF